MGIGAAYLLLTGSIVAQLALTGCAPKIDPNHPEAGLEAAASRDPNAAVVLGILYLNGTKVPQDFNEAHKWFQFAADHGNALGEFELGLLYESGKGVPRDPAQALKLLEAAKDQDFAPAKAELGAMYMRGNGVPRDETKGRTFIYEAAVKGFPLAQLLMGFMYANGQGGISDDSIAYQWASLAAAKLTGPQGELAKRLRAESEKGLTPEDISAAQAATAQWKQGMDVVGIIPPGSPPRPARLRSQGSGFVIGKRGEIATDFHVVPNCREIRIKDSDGKLNVVTKIFAQDPTNDIAILASAGTGNALKLGGEPPGLGTTIVTYGYPLGPVLAASGNMTTGTVSATTGMAGNAKSFQITAPVQPGSSGGPVVDESGAVIGIVASKLNALAIASATGDIAQNVNFAWRSDALKALLNEHGVAFETAHGRAPTQSTADLVNTLQKATVKVECWR